MLSILHLIPEQLCEVDYLNFTSEEAKGPQAHLVQGHTGLEDKLAFKSWCFLAHKSRLFSLPSAISNSNSIFFPWNLILNYLKFSDKCPLKSLKNWMGKGSLMLEFITIIPLEIIMDKLHAEKAYLIFSWPLKSRVFLFHFCLLSLQENQFLLQTAK